MTANDEYSFGIVRICRPRFRCNYLQNEKVFLILLFHLWNSHQILFILKKKMIVIVTLFRKLHNVNDLFRQLSKKQRFRTPLDSEHVQGSQKLAKRSWEHLYQIFSSLRENLIWKTSPSVICEILRVFPNTLTANEKYRVRNGENLSSPIQIKLSLIRKTFSDFFVPSLESTSNFKHFF